MKRSICTGNLDFILPENWLEGNIYVFESDQFLYCVEICFVLNQNDNLYAFFFWKNYSLLIIDIWLDGWVQSERKSGYVEYEFWNDSGSVQKIRFDSDLLKVARLLLSYDRYLTYLAVYPMYCILCRPTDIGS